MEQYDLSKDIVETDTVLAELIAMPGHTRQYAGVHVEALDDDEVTDVIMRFA